MKRPAALWGWLLLVEGSMFKVFNLPTFIPSYFPTYTPPYFPTITPPWFLPKPHKQSDKIVASTRHRPFLIKIKNKIRIMIKSKIKIKTDPSKQPPPHSRL